MAAWAKSCSRTTRRRASKDFDAEREWQSLQELVRQIEKRAHSPEIEAALRRQALGKRKQNENSAEARAGEHHPQESAALDAQPANPRRHAPRANASVGQTPTRSPRASASPCWQRAARDCRLRSCGPRSWKRPRMSPSAAGTRASTRPRRSPICWAPTFANYPRTSANAST